MTINGNSLKVDYDDNDDVAALKEKIKIKKSNNCKNVDVDRLTVWWCKKLKLLADANVNELEDVLDKVDFSNYRKAVWLASAKMVGSL